MFKRTIAVLLAAVVVLSAVGVAFAKPIDKNKDLLGRKPEPIPCPILLPAK